MKKKCGKCKQFKDILEFSKNKSRKSGVHNECKVCATNYNRLWFIQKNYKISKEEAEAIIAQIQSGEAFCEICNEALVLKKNGYAIDHNHNTQQVRGLLCSECNKGIGHLKEDLYVLPKAIKYLEKYNG